LIVLTIPNLGSMSDN